LQGISGTVRHDSKARNQYLGIQTAATDTRPRTGMESATTVHICNSARTHGNERQYMALRTAGRCMHGAKNNRVWQRAGLGVSEVSELAAT
jgi:hypothetical protein